MTLTTKPILYGNTGTDTKTAIKALESVSFPFVYDHNGSIMYQIPSLVYGDRVAEGVINIVHIARLWSINPNLNEVFETDSSDRVKKEKATIKEKQGYALLGFILGGFIMMFISKFATSFLWQSVLLILPIILVLAFPYYAPWIKEELKKEINQRKSTDIERK